MNRDKKTKYAVITLIFVWIFMGLLAGTGYTRSRARHHGHDGFRYDIWGWSSRDSKQMERSDRSDRHDVDRPCNNRFDRDFDGRFDHQPDTSSPISPRFGPDRPAPHYHFLFDFRGR